MQHLWQRDDPFDVDVQARALLRPEYEEPALTLAVACVESLEHCAEGPEIVRWRALFTRMQAGELVRLRKSMPEIAERIALEPDGELIFEQLYFSLVLPVAAAVDAENWELARQIFEGTIRRLERRWLVKKKT